MAVYRRVLHLRCLPHFQPPAALSSPLLTPSRSFVSSSSSAPSVEPQPPPLSVLPSGSVRNGSSGRWWDRQFFSTVGAVLVGQAAIFLGLCNDNALAQDDSVGLGATRNEQAEENATSLQRIEDGSVVSNEHTRNLDEAEKFFQAALHEAKEGFGLRDPHVASALNNLAEFYRLKKEYEKAELLVGTALHSLGICYHLQRKFALAQTCYEIEGRVMGVGHPEYASTMYLLGKVLSQQGKDAEALIEESIRVLEEAGLGDSPTCLQRMRYLSTGWDSLDTTNAAELLTLTLQTIGKLKESEELLERCLEVRKKILSEDHLQVAVTLVHLARLTMLNFVSDKKEDSDLSRSKLVRARLLVNDSMRIAEETLYDSREDLNKLKNGRTSDRDKIAAASALLQALEVAGLVESGMKNMLAPGEQDLYPVEQAVNKCISLYKEPHLRKLVSKALKNEYIRCLRRLTGIVQSNFAGSEALTLQGLLAEAQQIIEELGDASN
uniref:MalT-like TPR region domain-containing protein n=1 Tax=Leersia perrieri TaxID=77586 RepID=A0A0D9W339_9ORYZ